MLSAHLTKDEYICESKVHKLTIGLIFSENVCLHKDLKPSYQSLNVMLHLKTTGIPRDRRFGLPSA